MKINIKKAGIILAITICVFFSIHIIAILLEGEAGHLKKTIYKCKRLTEKEDILGLAGYISPDYHDELGNDKRSLLVVARSLFSEYRNVLISIDKLMPYIEKQNATAQVQVTVYWRENISEEIFYDRVKAEAKFQKEQGRWKLIELKFFEPEQKRLFRPLLA